MVRMAFGRVAIVFFLFTVGCQSADRPASPAVGSGGASGTGGAVMMGAGGAAGPITDPGMPNFRAGLQANGSITYVRSK